MTGKSCRSAAAKRPILVYVYIYINIIYIKVRALALSHPTLPEVTPHNGTAIAKVTPQKTRSHPTEVNPTGTAASTNFSINKILYLKTGVPMRFVHGVSLFWLHSPMAQTYKKTSNQKFRISKVFKFTYKLRA